MNARSSGRWPASGGSRRRTPADPKKSLPSGYLPMSSLFKSRGVPMLVRQAATRPRARATATENRFSVPRFSALSLLRRGLSRQRGWTPQWRRPEPKAGYDAIIGGGGRHGLGAAYYLAKEHGLTNIAVVKKGWIG